MLEFVISNKVSNLEEILETLKVNNIIDAKITIVTDPTAYVKSDIVLSSAPKKRLRQIAKICKELSNNGTLSFKKSDVIIKMKDITGMNTQTINVYFSGAVKAGVVQKDKHNEEVYIEGDNINLFYEMQNVI